MMNDEITKKLIIKKEQKKTARLFSQTHDPIHDTKITK